MWTERSRPCHPRLYQPDQPTHSQPPGTGVTEARPEEQPL